MSIKSRKKQLEQLSKTAEQQAKLTKIAQEVQQTSSSPDEYAKNFLKKLLEQAEVHLVGEDDIT